MLKRLPKWLRRLLKISLALFALLFAFLLFERWRGQIALASYKRELTAKGEKLTTTFFVMPQREGENGTPEVYAAYQKLQDGMVMQHRLPRKMQVTPSGHAIAVFRESDCIEDQATNCWDDLAADLQTNASALAQIQRALEKPVFDNHLDHSLGFKIPITNLIPAKALANWFGAASQLALHEGRTPEALDHLVTQARLPHLAENDRVVISELVRMAIAAVTKTSIWEALQSEGLTDQGLVQVQAAWAGNDFASAMTRSFEGERIFGDINYDVLRNSNQDTAQSFYWQEDFQNDVSLRPFWERMMQKIPYGDVIADFLKKEIYCRIWRFAWSHQDQRRYLEEMQRMIELLRRAETEKSYASMLPAITQLEQQFVVTGIYDNFRYSGTQSPFTLLRAVNKGLRAETDRSITICAIALKRYQLRYGNLPGSLDALVPEFVAAVPIDHMDGQPIRYHPNLDGSFALYSVGEDGKDDNGDASVLPDAPTNQTLWNRKDFIWPLPATPEEIDAWRKKSARN